MEDVADQNGDGATGGGQSDIVVHPYQRYETHKLWGLLESAIEDLVQNNDLIETTDRKYIVGYLCKALLESGCRIG